jgi:hypothetical protein
MNARQLIHRVLFLLAVGLFTVTASGALAADVPADLADAVEHQKKNKAAIVRHLQQQALAQRKKGNVEAAKQTTKLMEGVRLDKTLALPKFGEVPDVPGVIAVEKVVEKTGNGYRVETSLPRLEPRQGFDVNTGRATTSLWRGSEFIYHPATIDIATPREVKKGERVNVRRVQGGGYAEVPPEELDAAAKLLKSK